MIAASDDREVVSTRAEAVGLSRPPLLVIEALAEFLDAEGLGRGPKVPPNVLLASISK